MTIQIPYQQEIKSEPRSVATTQDDVVEAFGKYFTFANNEIAKARKVTAPIITRLTRYLSQNDGKK